MDDIRLMIDGQTVHIARGATILDAARQIDRDVPLLCYSDHTLANGLCRLCVVEIEERRGLYAACVTPAGEDMVVHTRSENVDRARRTILEMLDATIDLSESGELQQLLKEYDARSERFIDGAQRQPSILDDNPFFIRDYAKCVMCWRCVQVCAADAQFTYAINFGGRGFHSHIATFFDQPLTESTCVFCGQCVGTCPTGALKGKREFLYEQGVPVDELIEATRVQSKGKRLKRKP